MAALGEAGEGLLRSGAELLRGLAGVDDADLAVEAAKHFYASGNA